MWMITAPKTILLFLKTEIKLEYSFLERNKVKPSAMNMIVIVLWTESENNSMNEKETEYVKRCWDIEETSDRKKSKNAAAAWR